MMQAEKIPHFSFNACNWGFKKKKEKKTFESCERKHYSALASLPAPRYIWNFQSIKEAPFKHAMAEEQVGQRFISPGK